MIALDTHGDRLFTRPLRFAPFAIAPFGDRMLVIGSQVSELQPTLAELGPDGALLRERALPTPAEVERPGEVGQWELTRVGEVDAWAAEAIGEELLVLGGMRTDDAQIVFVTRLRADGESRWVHTSALHWEVLQIGARKTRPSLWVHGEHVYVAGPFGGEGGRGFSVLQLNVESGEALSRHIDPESGFGAAAFEGASGRIAVAGPRNDEGRLWLFDGSLAVVREQRVAGRPLAIAFASDAIWLASGSRHEDYEASIQCVRVEEEVVEVVSSFDDTDMHPSRAQLISSGDDIYLSYVVYRGSPLSGSPHHAMVRGCSREATFDSRELGIEWADGSDAVWDAHVTSGPYGLRLAMTNGYALAWADIDVPR